MLLRNRYLALRFAECEEHITFVYLYKTHKVDVLLCVDTFWRQLSKPWQQTIIFSQRSTMGLHKDVTVLLPEQQLVLPKWLHDLRGGVISSLFVAQPHSFEPHITTNKLVVQGTINRLALMVGTREEQTWEFQKCR